jgi:hypothetical protein
MYIYVPSTAFAARMGFHCSRARHQSVRLRRPQEAADKRARVPIKAKGKPRPGGDGAEPEVRARILVDKSRVVFGVADPTGELNYGECFFQPTVDGLTTRLVGGYVTVVGT